MHCRIPIDWDKRFQLSKDGVVHAARTINVKTTVQYKYNYTSHKQERVGTVPAHDRLMSACSTYWSKDPNDFMEVANTTEITCKNCMKAMGIKPTVAPSNKRYVLMEVASGYFYKNGGYSTSVWQDDVMNATLYKTKKGARDNGKISFYMKGKKRLTSAEHWKIESKKEREKYKYHTELSDKYVVRAVQIKLLDSK